MSLMLLNAAIGKCGLFPSLVLLFERYACRTGETWTAPCFRIAGDGVVEGMLIGIVGTRASMP